MMWSLKRSSYNFPPSHKIFSPYSISFNFKLQPPSWIPYQIKPLSDMWILGPHLAEYVLELNPTLKCTEKCVKRNNVWCLLLRCFPIPSEGAPDPTLYQYKVMFSANQNPRQGHCFSGHVVTSLSSHHKKPSTSIYYFARAIVWKVSFNTNKIHVSFSTCMYICLLCTQEIYTYWHSDLHPDWKNYQLQTATARNTDNSSNKLLGHLKKPLENQLVQVWYESHSFQT